MRKKIGIVGYGNFGKFIHKHLASYFDIVVYDKNLKKSRLNDIISVDILIIAIPVSSFESFLKEIKDKISESVLVIDVASVKIKPVRLMKKYLKNEMLALHPLFGPESGKNGIENLTIVYYPVKIDNKKLLHIKTFLTKNLKVKLKKMTPEEHDRQMAYVQGITHFLGKAINNLNLPDFKEKTKAYGKLLEIKQLLKRTTFDLFETIENENPYSKRIRNKFLKELTKLENKLRGEL